MSKEMKTIEVEGKEVKAIKAEQLKAVKDQQAKMQALLIDVGFLEAKKHEVMPVSYTHLTLPTKRIV